MRKILSVLLLLLAWACKPTPTPVFTPRATPPPAVATAFSIASPTVAATAIPLPSLPEGCKTPGKVTSAELPQPASGSAYSYRLYLPPCYSADSESRYPVLYLIPGSKSSPDSWLKAGLPGEMDKLILGKTIPPMIVITTENTDADPMGETIYKELIPAIERQYPIAAGRRYRAVAGGSLGGITAYRLAFRYPDTFSSAGLFGSGLAPGEETQVRLWLAQMNDTNRMRVFLNSGTEDAFMLDRARAMKSVLDEMGIENQLYVDASGHHYKYWIPNFDKFLAWISEQW
ncbi:MAG: alpha/beta hydrolase [Byssovorax cruenta]